MYTLRFNRLDSLGLIRGLDMARYDLLDLDAMLLCLLLFTDCVLGFSVEILNQALHGNDFLVNLGASITFFDFISLSFILDVLISDF